MPRAFEILPGDVSYRFISCGLAFHARHGTRLVAEIIQLYGDLDPRTALATGRGAGILPRENDVGK
jgi:hypothetical protein